MDGPDAKRTIAPDPNLARILKRRFEQYAAGKYLLKEIAKIARTDGFAYRKSSVPAPVSTVRKILRNRIYGGDSEFDAATYHGSYQPIVSRKL